MSDPFASKPLLWGKHCRGPGCDDFNEQIPSCACVCSACKRPSASTSYDMGYRTALARCVEIADSVSCDEADTSDRMRSAIVSRLETLLRTHSPKKEGSP